MQKWRLTQQVIRAHGNPVVFCGRGKHLKVTVVSIQVTILGWIEPGTAVISDCWFVYMNIETHGYTHQTVKNTIGFVDARTGVHKDKIESTWRHVNSYNRMGGQYVSSSSLNVCGGLPTQQSGQFHQVHRHRCNHGLVRHTCPPSRLCCYETRRSPTPHFGPFATHYR